jgi:DNA polymerase-1
MLIDGNALIHRAYHALPPLTGPSGEPTHATFGFTSMLLKAVAEQKPTHVVVAFDSGRTFRHEDYADYKANRARMDDSLAVQFESVRRIIDAFAISRCAVAGFEADDLLGTLARQAHEKGLETLIVTGDTDALQLVRPDVKVLTSGRRFSDTVLYDVEAVQERYGLQPEQLIDYKALVGDTSDNVPGVPGVGPKTATQLLQEFGTLEGIYAHLDQVRGARTRAALEANREQALAAKRLVTIVTEAPATLDLEAARFGDYRRDAVMAVFRELGFRSLTDRLPEPQGGEGAGTDGSQLTLFGAGGEPPRPGQALGEYQVVCTEEALAALVRELAGAPMLAIDVETTGLDAMRASLVGIALSDRLGRGFYIPVGHEACVAPEGQLELGRVLERLRPLLADEGIPKIAHNAKYDLTVLAEHGLEVRGLAWDTMLAAWLTNPASRNLGLKGLAWEKLALEMMPIEALIGKGRAKVTMAQVPVEQAASYACADADVTLRLRGRLEPELCEREQEKLFCEIEMPLVPVLLEMERRGVALDVPALEAMSRELYERLAVLEQAIYRLAGQPFNISSTQQLGALLFDKLGLRGVRRTQTGNYSTDAAALEALRGQHEIIELIQEYRQLGKLKSTYVDALPLLVNRRTGRVHTSFNQAAVVTGRLSSSDPNLQNIPIRTGVGSQIRRAFVAAEGWRLLAADYSQVELRILAHVTGDSAMLDAFARDEDIHARTAAMLHGVPLERVTPQQRSLAKTVNFGVLYGMGDYGLAQRTELSQEEAGQFIEGYFARFPAVQAYLENTKRLAREQGYVETLFGRRRYFPELTADSRVPMDMRRAAERMAINMPIQGTAADIIKIAMIRLHRALHEHRLRAAMILQVHDELVLEVPEDELEAVRPLVRSVMEGAFDLQAPLRVNIEVGRNWLEMR